jgi:hypothetical protein
MLRRPASESLQRTKPRWGADGGAAGTMGIWPQRRKRWGVGEAMDRKDGWLADAESARAGAPEIEITSEMIGAGAEDFSRWSNGASMEFGDEKLAAECIFKAMISAAKIVHNRGETA